MASIRLTDGGLETSLIFHQGLDLPDFAAFPLLESESGRAALTAYWQPYLALARDHDVGLVIDTPTWRANPDWGARLGYDATGLRAVAGAATAYAVGLAAEVDGSVVTGVVGPRGDGYVVGGTMTSEAAEDYHRPQVAALADAGVDQVSFLTATYAAEATGFVRAAVDAGVPAVVSFTVETDGRLPDGQSLRDAVARVDEDTDAAASGFMVNCAHPTHVAPALATGPWLDRIVGLRVNASAMSHAELDAADELDDGDPVDLARRCRELVAGLPSLAVLGGCCGTDHRHLRAMAETCLA